MFIVEFMLRTRNNNVINDGIRMPKQLIDFNISRLPKLDQSSPSVDDKDFALRDYKASLTHQVGLQDEEASTNFMLITPLLLSKKKLLFEQCSMESKDYCNIQLLEDLLREIGPNVLNEDGETPLFVALKNLPKSINHVVFETLIQNGADGMTRYKEDRGSLVDIIFHYGDQRVISAYLPYHNQVDAVLNNLEETALHILAFRKGPYLVKTLLQRGASPDVRDIDGKTPLHVAVSRGSLEIVEILIKFGANINAQCKEGLTPLHYACGVLDKGCIDILLKHKCNVNVQDEKKRTPLFYFIKYPCNHDSLLEKLFNAGCKIKGAAKSFRPLHMLASECIFIDNAVKYAKILIQRGVDVNGTNESACTALHLAARFSTEKFVECLLENGASCNGYTLYNQTPLDIAVRWKQDDIVVQIMKSVSVHRYQRQTIARKILTRIETTDNLHSMHRKLRGELIILSRRDLKVSYMDIYQAGWGTLLEYTKNEEIVAYVDSLEAEKFPFYGKYIKMRFREALRRRKAVEYGLEYLYGSFQDWLPFLCVKIIVQYLSTEDLERLRPLRSSKVEEKCLRTGTQ